MKKQAKPWQLSEWNDGYIRDGRFIVYRPDYPRADSTGHATRAHVVWWLTHNRVPESNEVIHHINHNPMDDRPENLMLMTRIDHSRHHHELHPPSKQICLYCNKEFDVQFNIISQHIKEGRQYGQAYCSHRCSSDARKGKRGKSYRGMTVDKVKSIRARKEDGERVADLAKEYGMSISGIYAIIRGDNWGDIN